jgi:hypothetical protein
MKTIDVQDVPKLHESRVATRPTQRKGIVGPSQMDRRTFMQTAGAVGIGVGLVIVGAPPPARRALAHHGVKYDIKDRPCPTGGGPGGIGDFYEDNPACEPCGPSTVYPNACETTFGQHYIGYHKDNANWNLRPGECVPNSDFYDGWLWHVGQTCGTGGCTDWVIYRCHDGYKILSGGGTDESVCKWVCDCPGLPDDCVTDTP